MTVNQGSEYREKLRHSLHFINNHEIGLMRR